MNGSFTLLGLAKEWPRNNFVRINIELLPFYCSIYCSVYTGQQSYNLSWVSSSVEKMQRALNSKGRSSLLPTLSPYSSTLSRSRPVAANTLNFQQQRFAHKVRETFPVLIRCGGPMWARHLVPVATSASYPVTKSTLHRSSNSGSKEGHLL